ncbi:MAG: hypothetical protein QG653_368 [Patescibacteria group bacterium]|nr:hypothetical protein [Patescibacteria group bacterium]
MKNLIVTILVFLFPCGVFAEEKEITSPFSQEEMRLLRECCLAKEVDPFVLVSPEYAQLVEICCRATELGSPDLLSREEKRILENCCLARKEESKGLLFSNIKTSDERFLTEVFKRRKWQFLAIKTATYREGWSLRTKRKDGGYYIAVSWESNRDPIKFLFEPFFIFESTPHK